MLPRKQGFPGPQIGRGYGYDLVVCNPYYSTERPLGFDLRHSPWILGYPPQIHRSGCLLSTACLCTLGVVPGGSLFDELAELIDPTLKDPADEPQGVKVGRLNDDGTYTSRPESDILRDHFNQQYPAKYQERAVKLGSQIQSLKSMGFELVYEGDEIIEELGLVKAPAWQDSYGLVHVRF